MKALLRALITAACIGFLAGCPVTPTTQDVDPPTEPDDTQQVDELFVQDANDPTAYDFQTNDSAYWGSYGYTLWALTGSQSPFSSRSVTATKISGNDSAGYGIVFGHYDTGDPAQGETMLVALINTKQEFTVGEVTDAAYTYIVDWTTCPALKLGYSQANTIRVDYSAGVYSLYLNGEKAKEFRDTEAPVHENGGGVGLIVVISPLDTFPTVPVHVSFKEN